MAEPVNLTNRQLLDLSRGLLQLDAIREGENEFVALQFETKVSYRLMRNSVIVERELAAFKKADRQAARDQCVFEGMAATEENAVRADRYQRVREELLDQEVRVEGLMLLTVDELLLRPEEDRKTKSKRNPVPQSVLHRLAPILKEEA